MCQSDSSMQYESEARAPLASSLARVPRYLAPRSIINLDGTGTCCLARRISGERGDGRGKTLPDWYGLIPQPARSGAGSAMTEDKKNRAHARTSCQQEFAWWDQLGTSRDSALHNIWNMETQLIVSLTDARLAPWISKDIYGASFLRSSSQPTEI